MKGKHHWVALVALVLAAASLGATAAASAPERSQVRTPELRRALGRIVAAGAPSAIALIRDRERTIRLTSGFGNLKTNAPMRPSDRFRIGSVAKTFLATVVLQVVGQGKLSLDDTVERWLPGLVPNGRKISVRHLLNMKSGLFDYLDDGDPTVLKPYLEGNLTYVWQPRKLVEVAVSHKPHFAPGAGWYYCNTCYVALGLIVEAATGDSLRNQLRPRIFLPLRLRAISKSAWHRETIGVSCISGIGLGR
jgi:D-alanyl-D-alanine carboxypeptidase